MMDLNYSEKLLLVLYKELYGQEYTCQKRKRIQHVDEKKEISQEHLQAQKAVYLFSLYNIYVNDFAFVWDQRGPYSPDLSRLLRILDDKGEEVKNFYREYNNNKPHCLDALLTDKEIDRMNQLVEAIGKFFWGKGETLCDTAEMIGSVVFLHHKLTPEYSQEQLQRELVQLKPYLRVTMEESMWDALKKNGLVSI